MKLLMCIIRPEKLDDVVAELESIAPGLTVSEVKGHGHQKGHPMVYRGLEYDVPLVRKVMIEVVADDNKVDDIVKRMIQTARTGEIGDGRIFVLPVEENYHVRTGFMELD